MPKSNCWDVKRCGTRATCPAALEKRMHGVHGGQNAGRACWIVAGTLCGGVVQGKFAAKAGSCMQCAFYQQVQQEEAGAMMLARDLMAKLG